mgnify:CR=1 FL=1
MINEFCYLAGRGGLKIGNNVNIALFSMLITATHDQRSKSFRYFTEGTELEDDVWIGARAVVLNGCRLGKGCIIGAGSVLSPRTNCEPYMLFAGVPAKQRAPRGLEEDLNIEPWNVWFR